MGFRDAENIFPSGFIALFGCRSVLVISLNTARLYWLKKGGPNLIWGRFESYAEISVHVLQSVLP